jgi:hypothetical protein
VEERQHSRVGVGGIPKLQGLISMALVRGQLEVDGDTFGLAVTLFGAEVMALLVRDGAALRSQMATTRHSPTRQRQRNAVLAALVFSSTARRRATSRGVAVQSKEQRSIDAGERNPDGGGFRSGEGCGTLGVL